MSMANKLIFDTGKKAEDSTGSTELILLLLWQSLQNRSL